MNLSPAERLGVILVAIATPCVIVGLSVLVFLNPIWIGFEQDRSNIDKLTGYTSAQVHEVTGSILSDLVFGPPNFAVTVDGAPVLDARERGHMVDVRTVMGELGFVAVLAAVMLVALGLYSRGRRWFWWAASIGARVLLVGVVVVGLAMTLVFDQIFELFHEIFFAPGTYLFNTSSEKLVQLFPDQFWSETSIALAGVVLVLAVIVGQGGGRLAARAEVEP
ncbi:MAG TPA: TIGR01906 family membrane protein [Candidatus Limnocylindrales bacterium]